MHKFDNKIMDLVLFFLAFLVLDVGYKRRHKKETRFLDKKKILKGHQKLTVNSDLNKMQQKTRTSFYSFIKQA